MMFRPLLHGAPNSPVDSIMYVVMCLALFLLAAMMFSNYNPNPDEIAEHEDPDEIAIIPE